MLDGRPVDNITKAILVCRDNTINQVVTPDTTFDELQRMKNAGVIELTMQ